MGSAHAVFETLVTMCNLSGNIHETYMIRKKLSAPIMLIDPTSVSMVYIRGRHMLMPEQLTDSMTIEDYRRNVKRLVFFVEFVISYTVYETEKIRSL